jgi:hypothetical protein
MELGPLSELDSMAELEPARMLTRNEWIPEGNYPPYFLSFFTLQGMLEFPGCLLWVFQLCCASLDWAFQRKSLLRNLTFRLLANLPFICSILLDYPPVVLTRYETGD